MKKSVTFKSFVDGDVSVIVKNNSEMMRLMLKAQEYDLKWCDGDLPIPGIPNDEYPMVIFNEEWDNGMSYSTFTEYVNESVLVEELLGEETKARKSYRVLKDKTNDGALTVGKVYTLEDNGDLISDHGYRYPARVHGDVIEWLSFWYDFEDVTGGVAKSPRYSITIECDGDVTTAKMVINGKEVKTATAKRNPEDTFDWKVGAQTAFGRLWESEPKSEFKVKRPLAVGDRVVCIHEVDGNNHVKGECGTVIGVHGDYRKSFTVQFDQNIGGHSGRLWGVCGKEGHCWYCPEKSLMRIIGVERK